MKSPSGGRYKYKERGEGGACASGGSFGRRVGGEELAGLAKAGVSGEELARSQRGDGSVGSGERRDADLVRRRDADLDTATRRVRARRRNGRRAQTSHPRKFFSTSTSTTAAAPPGSAPQRTPLLRVGTGRRG